VYHYLILGVVTLESILICLYLESGMDGMEVPNINMHNPCVFDIIDQHVCSMISDVYIYIFHL
jgi:hypothetical protein